MDFASFVIWCLVSLGVLLSQAVSTKTTPKSSNLIFIYAPFFSFNAIVFYNFATIYTIMQKHSSYFTALLALKLTCFVELMQLSNITLLVSTIGAIEGCIVTRTIKKDTYLVCFTWHIFPSIV